MIPDEILPFSKYKRSGPYHWDHLSRNLKKHNCITASRYALMLDFSQLRSGERVLDVGCGDGALTYFLFKKGAICTGVEPDATGRSLAETKFRNMSAKASFRSDLSEVSPESQDVVICSEVIEHIQNPDNFLLRIKEVLRPGGRLILSTPVRLTETLYDREHVKEYFPSELREMIGDHFTIIDHKFEIPVFAIELYYWRPWFSFNKPVGKLIMNMLSAWFGISVMRKLKSLNRYFLLQIIIARKM